MQRSQKHEHLCAKISIISAKLCVHQNFSGQLLLPSRVLLLNLFKKKPWETFLIKK